jgi:hypothetical protein
MIDIFTYLFACLVCLFGLSGWFGLVWFKEICI